MQSIIFAKGSILGAWMASQCVSDCTGASCVIVNSGCYFQSFKNPSNFLIWLVICFKYFDLNFLLRCNKIMRNMFTTYIYIYIYVIYIHIIYTYIYTYTYICNIYIHIYMYLYIYQF